MKYKKHILSFIIIIIAVFSASPIFADDNVDITILLESAKQFTKEQKLIALLYIEDMLERNNSDYTISVMHEVLKYLSFEGPVNIAIADKMQNDFPDIRLKAVKLLGQLGTIEAKTALLEVLKYENDILVRIEAIRALFLNKSDIQKNENGMNVLFYAIIGKQVKQNQ
jgi:HEAT repeat protein